MLKNDPDDQIEHVLAFCSAVLSHILTFHAEAIPDPVKSKGYEAIKRARPFLNKES